jgi:hypothetical protein
MYNLKSVANVIKEAGFNFFKIEMEADLSLMLDRIIANFSKMLPCSMCFGNKAYSEVCRSCEGLGFFTCHHCEEGKIKTISGGYITCPYCKGQTRPACNSCHGEGKFYNRTDKQCGNCNGTGQKVTHSTEHIFKGIFLSNLPENMRQALEYCLLYRDGINSHEITLTLPIEFIIDSDKIIEAFKSAINILGAGYNSTNAGIHICLLQDRYYPPRKPLPLQKLTNFKRAMNKMMLALVLIGSGDGRTTRNFIWRDLAAESEDKYSAVYTPDNSVIEFRVFDTCYENPKRVTLFVQTIAQCLRFYSDNPPPIKLAQLDMLKNSPIINKSFSRGRMSRLSYMFKNKPILDRARQELELLLDRKISIPKREGREKIIERLANIEKTFERNES